MVRGPGSRIAREAAREFPDAPTRTLARKKFLEHPGVWPSLNAAVVAIRAARGLKGDKRRHLATNLRAPRNPTEDWVKYLPESWEDGDEWKPFNIPGPFRALVLGDLQAPFHHTGAVKVAINYGRDHGADTVILNGDFVDHYSQSRFVTDPKFRDYPLEVRIGRQLLQSIRKAFPDAQIIYKHGNHEERFENYMRMKCPELLGIPEFTWDNAYGVGDLDIEVVKDKRPIMAGDLPIIHGHELSNGGGGVMPARSYFLKGLTHSLAGHVHRTSQFSVPTMQGKLITTFTTGCLCGLHPEFARVNQWNHGFAFVDIDKAGAFTVENKRIVDGKAW